MMQFGVCGDPEIAPVAKTAGFDYFEWSVGGLLKPREPEPAFRAALAAVRASPLPCPVVNCFVPGDLKIVGGTADLEALSAYVTTTFARAEQAGVQIVVFGSGGARQVPDGWSRDDARRQLADFGRMLAPIAARHGVTVAIESLRKAECNILNTVAEGAALAQTVNHPALALLVDGFHWATDGDDAEAIVEQGGRLVHTHIATTANRLAPGMETCDFHPFFDALRRAGYTGRMSIEGGLGDPAATLPVATRMLRSNCSQGRQ